VSYEVSISFVAVTIQRLSLRPIAVAHAFYLDLSSRRWSFVFGYLRIVMTSWSLP
jgi:hypothetical protein